MRISNSTCASLRRRGGYVLVLFIISLTALMGVTGLVIDLGLMMVAYRKAQNAADSGAFAGAVELSNGNASNVVSEATRFVTTQNGATVPSSLHPQLGPRSGPYTGNANFVEVYADVAFNTNFLHLLGYASTQTVQARAVAGLQFTTFNSGLLLLSPSGSGALTDSGNGSISVTGGGLITVNSNSHSAVNVSGNGNVSATTVNITGNYTDSGNGAIKGTIDTGATAVANPLAYLTAPDPSSLTVQSNTQVQISGNTSKTLQPGVYKGGILVSGNGSVTLTAGIYYMEGGGFSSTGNASVTGSGVMIYNAPAAAKDVINISGNGSLNLTPPTSGAYQGLTIFQSPTSTNRISITGNGGSIGGTIYAPDAQVTLSGNGGLSAAQIVSSSIQATGNGSVSVNFGGNTALTPLIFLVE